MCLYANGLALRYRLKLLNAVLDSANSIDLVVGTYILRYYLIVYANVLYLKNAKDKLPIRYCYLR